jgi:GDP/UDP-N,N'-diacetylbacillosamine 2-epimerase (hydrolysing)
MKIGVLTSSRADYGIYLPLLEKIKIDSFFDLEIIAFGTHVSKTHGCTVQEIEKDGYKIIHQIDTLLSDDDETSIAKSYGLTIVSFADFWSKNKYDLVFCLGDRFEMSAAIQAGIPFGVKFAHLHGGETTLGAIDNIYRHQITLASTLHFTSALVFKERVIQLTENEDFVFDVGSLSLDNIKSFQPIDKKIFYTNFNITKDDYVLVTFHPETVSSANNYQYAEVMKNALAMISKDIFVVITMPNADTLGSIYREKLLALKNENPNRILLIENFGKANYFSAMYYAKILIGNTSSGIIEAASFEKYVVNVGDRQKGRLQSNNILNCTFDVSEMKSKVTEAINLGSYQGENVYFKKEVANTIIKVVKHFYDNI